ncbi:MAG: hypothetical protein JXR89_12690 [Deltaproteobacteria bacterium]|nr:hypothetical protein [Deltaproteobacteria bacterium]
MGKTMRKAFLLTMIVGILLWAGPLLALSGGQQVKIPYVVSMPDAGWWTGIAITNDSGEIITNMELAFTTASGYSGLIFKTRAVTEPIVGPIGPIVPISYTTTLEDIAAHAILVNTLDALYTGSGSKTLPSETGSIVLSHTGSAPFYVTLYIGNPEGFAFQVFKSESVLMPL